MNRWLRAEIGDVRYTWLALALLTSLAGSVHAQTDDGAAPPPSASTCVEVHARIRYSMGYDHLVDLKNSCQKPVICQVSTNVNPKPQKAELAAGASTTVVTFIGSPAREFTPQVNCQFL